MNEREDFLKWLETEHTSATWNGEPRTYTLRVTQLYRREAGTWKVFHRATATRTSSALLVATSN